MLEKLMKDRLESLDGLDKDIDVALQELDMQAVDKDEKEKRERFKGVSKELQLYLRNYKESLEAFLNRKPGFTFEDYKNEFDKKDVKLNGLLQGYMFFRSQLV